ncbi:MAG: phenylacetaldoxime dehydratase family protein [Pseudomonadota bacterium]
MSAMPENWEPPVDAWQSRFAPGVTEIVFGYFGVQYAPGGDIGAFERWWDEAGVAAPAPSFMTRAHVRDASDMENTVFIAYWPSKSDFDAWWETVAVSAWWEDEARLSGPFGVWREVYCVPVDHFETLHSSQTEHGVASIAQDLGEPIKEHAYWGGMRDRVPASSQLDFSSPWAEMPEPDLKATRGARVRVAVPDNVCLIRSGQDLTLSSGKERETYQDVVRPHLTAGMAFLRDNPKDTSCFSCRLMDEVSMDGAPKQQTFGLAAFRSMKDLEDWSKSHPTHLAIFGSFFQMMEAHQGQLDLKLWHEVLVADGANTIADYTNCHPRTGFLPWCPTIQEVDE